MSSVTKSTVIACVVVSGASIWAIRHWLYPKPIDGIPHFPITSILGDVPAMREAAKKKGEMVSFFSKGVNELGPIFQLFLGTSTLVIVADAQEIEDLQLRSRAKALDASYRVTGRFGGLLPNGQVSLPMDDLWKKHRRIGGPFMSANELIRDTIRGRIQRAYSRAANVQLTGADEEPACALDMIIEKDQQDKAQPYTTEQLEDEMVSYVLAGFDTTASALSFAIKFLARHPEVQIKLHEELMTNLVEPGNRAITYDEVAGGDITPYLEAVVHETLRVAQVGAATVRKAVEDVVILGKLVPKGSDLLLLNGFACNHATKSWAEKRASASPTFKSTKGSWDDDDVTKFIPERWLIDGPDGRRVFSASQGFSIPFGLGPKSCFGQKLALLELKVYIATLSLAFFLEKVPEELDTNENIQALSQKPKQAYVSLVDWEDK
ncbi:hypothetical protein FRC03_007900 [Tulasnella sp. 419]|nr:hypothetical protein FRC03_007900 [Tulasnella sp. 419]